MVQPYNRPYAFVFGSLITCRAVWERRNEECEVFGNEKYELNANFSATMVTIWKTKIKKSEIGARESVNSSPIDLLPNYCLGS